MKKVLLTIGIILVALAVMAPGPPDKAEKLRFDENGWEWEFEYDPILDEGTYYLDVNMSAKFGIATAAFHNEQFKVSLFLDAVDHENNEWDITSSKSPILKLGLPKDEYGYVELVTQTFSWNGDDDGSGKVSGINLNLISPGGNVVSSTLFPFAEGEELFIHGDAYCDPAPGSPYPCLED